MRIWAKDMGRFWPCNHFVYAPDSWLDHRAHDGAPASIVRAADGMWEVEHWNLNLIVQSRHATFGEASDAAWELLDRICKDYSNGKDH